MQVLDAILTRVNFHQPSKYANGLMYLIAQVHTGSTVKGLLEDAVVGENYRFHGEFKPQKRGGVAFEFVSAEPIIERTTGGIASYLMKHCPAIGPARADAVVAAFGVDTLDVLRADPSKALGIAGINAEAVERIREFFENDLSGMAEVHARLEELFADFKVTKRVIKRLIKDFQGSAPDIVRKRPYLMLQYPGLGWEKVDSFATTKVGYDPRGLDRHVEAIAEGLRMLAADGHTWGYRPEIEELAFRLVGGSVRPDAWAAGVEGVKFVEVIDGESPVGFALPDLAAAERDIARRLVSLLHYARPLRFDLPTDGLQGEQVAAVEVIQENGVAILAGAPGTGKSFTISKVIGGLIDNDARSIRLAAPTGKAAKRSAELIAQNVPAVAGTSRACDRCGGTGVFGDDLKCFDCDGAGAIEGDGVPCTTIHKMLSPKPSDEAEVGVPTEVAKVGRGRDEFTFGHDEQSPIPVDHLVLEEMSMTDVKLAVATFKATPNGARVILVGDPNQLPSVQAGSVLRDIMDAMPSAYLTEIRRSQPGRVIRACHAIIAGRTPEPGDTIDLEAGENWIHVEMDDPMAMSAKIVELCRPYRAFPDPFWDIQVIGPQKERPAWIGCDPLNAALSEKLNNAVGPASREDEGPTSPFRVGDKVVRTKNGLCDQMVCLGRPDDFDWAEGTFAHEDPGRRVDWHWDDRDWKLVECPIVNGDMGTVRDVVDTERTSHVVVEFRNPTRLCRLPGGVNAHLIQAYAMTCHRAQGSGFPMVIVPVHHDFYWNPREEKGIFCREWLYTAISRAEKLLVTVGQHSAIAAAVRRKTVHKRKTRLAGLIREEMRLRAEREAIARAEAERQAEEAKRRAEAAPRVDAEDAGPEPPWDGFVLTAPASRPVMFGCGFLPESEGDEVELFAGPYPTLPTALEEVPLAVPAKARRAAVVRFDADGTESVVARWATDRWIQVAARKVREVAQ